ncbi:hypothetical protein, partial [Pseudomonas syringae]|uniref:hypothetical protein n=1 Tax=Pseudomonas syringae TaxID=317 RepID=UPI001FEF22FE
VWSSGPFGPGIHTAFPFLRVELANFRGDSHEADLSLAAVLKTRQSPDLKYLETFVSHEESME